MKLRFPALTAWVLTLLTTNEPAPVEACAVAWPWNTPVSIADESAIIVWDAATKTEQFIRKASFRTEAKDFGFLVPTPTRPALSEVNDQAFDMLYSYTYPEVETKKIAGGGCLLACSKSNDRGVFGSAAPLRVLEETTVAGYDAAVLEADNAEALGEWLKAREYPFTDSLKEWAKPYIAGKWKFTAFKITKAEGARDRIPRYGVGMPAVKMTFQTEKPFYPYREPKSDAPEPEAKAGRLLRVYFLGEKRVQGTIGEWGDKWPGTTVWANTLDAKMKEGDLFRHLQQLEDQAAKNWYLTEFEDRSSPRPGAAELFFTPADDQTAVKRPVHTRYTKANAVPCIMTAALASLMILSFGLRRMNLIR